MPKQTLAEAINEALDAPTISEETPSSDEAIEADDTGFTPSADATGEPQLRSTDEGTPATEKNEGALPGVKPAVDDQETPEEKAAKEKKASDDKAAADATAGLLHPGGVKPAGKEEPKPSDDPERPLKNISDKDLAELPKGVKAETTQRFKELTRRLEERTTAIASIQNEAKMYAGVITSFETGPENISRLAKFSRALATNTPESLEFAYKEWKTIGAQLSRALGRPLDLGGEIKIDPLVDHPDLQAKVADFSMTREDALKAVADRSHARLNDTNRQQQDHQRQAETVVRTAIESMQGIENYWMQTLQTPEGSLMDAPTFIHPQTAQPTSMKALMIEYGTQLGLAVRQGQLHPNDAVQRANQYAGRLGQQIIAARNNGTLRPATGQGGGMRQQQPMRAGGGGGVKPTPTAGGDAGGSLYDAISAGLGMA